MTPTEPGQVAELFERYFKAGDLEGLTSLYEDDARIVPGAGQEPIVGVPGIKEFLQGFLASGATVTILASTSVQSGDIALTHSRWRMEQPGGEPMEGVTAEVVRRQPDGSWLYAVDNPWGGAVLATPTP